MAIKTRGGIVLLLLPYLSQPSLAPFSARPGSIGVSARIRIGSASKTSARIRSGLGRIRKAKERLGYMKRCVTYNCVTFSKPLSPGGCGKQLVK
jgi:hypothetical protein